MEVPQARITAAPVFPLDVPSLFPDSGKELRRFPVFSVIAIGTVSSVFDILLYRPGTLGTSRTKPGLKGFHHQ
jgi:hypothetical protein